MSSVDLTHGRWRLHRHYGQATPAEMVELAKKVLPTGTNTTVLLKFEVQPSELNATAPASLQVTWYKGCIEKDDPLHDEQDNHASLGYFWAKVFPPAIDSAFESIQLIQESFPPANTHELSIATTVRMFVGKRTGAGVGKFFGHGADNWANEINTFTLTYEEWNQ